jgi:hypothetical protein
MKAILQRQDLRTHLGIAIGATHQNADLTHTACLRARHQRPRRRGADKRDEIPSSHFETGTSRVKLITL